MAPAAFRGLTATANCPVGDADLSSLLSVDGIQLYNTQTPGGPVAYAHNCVPITNPVALYLFAHPNVYPLPNNPTGDPLGIQNNFSGPSGQFQRNDQGDIKIDWHFRTKDVVSGRYSRAMRRTARPTSPSPLQFPSASNYPDHLFTTDWNHTFTPAISTRCAPPTLAFASTAA